MAEHVSFEMTRPITCVVAMIAAKRYLPSVFRHVCLQTLILRGFVVALGASTCAFSEYVYRWKRNCTDHIHIVFR